MDEEEIEEETEEKEEEKAPEEKTVSKKLYDQKVSELARANRELKKYRESDTDIASRDSRISELEGLLEKEKVDTQLLMKLNQMGCSDTDYALYKIHQANPDIRLNDEGKVDNIGEIADAVKTSNPAVFTSSREVEVDVESSKLGKGTEKDNSILTKKDFLRKSYGERATFASEHPDEFNELMKQEDN